MSEFAGRVGSGLAALVKLLVAKREFFLGRRCRFPIPPNDVWVEQATRAARNDRGGPMRVMVIVKATEQSEAESHPLEMEGAEEMFEQMGKFNEELIKAGIMLAGDGLKPSKFGKRIHFNGTRRSVTDGPFAETKELVAGFWIWQVRSMEEAVEWAKRCPNPMPGPSDLEIRPIWESEDFGPEIAAGVNEQRAKIAKNTV
jgi:hypothetical protein